MKVYIYQWICCDDNKINVRGYGLNEKNETICVHVNNFYPWLSIELKDTKNIEKSKFLKEVKNLYEKNRRDFTEGGIKENLTEKTLKKKLYFDHSEKKFEIFKIYFSSIQKRKECYFLLKDKNVLYNRSKCLIHEYEASPILQFLSKYNISSCGWVEIENIKSDKNFSSVYEIDVDVDHIKSYQSDKVPTFKSMSFDIEVYSHKDGVFPKAVNKEDVIFQIAVTFSDMKNVLLTIFCDKNKQMSIKDTEIRTFKNEKELLIGFYSIIKERQPHIIMGYNIFGFDFPYIIDRCKRYNIPINKLGLPKIKAAEYREIKWSSSAYACQNFRYLDFEGVLCVDMLPIIKRDYKFNNYKLKTVSDYFLGQSKDPLTVKDIFAAYRNDILEKGKGSKLQKCGKYCVQDSRLVLLLFNKLQTLIGLLEMAKICNVGIMALFVSGQQIKVFSQVFKKCYNENRLVDSFNSITIPDNIQFNFDNFCGAYVFPPIPGIYKWVVPFDFTSLYPTTIIAYNIDYSTLVYDENVPDEKCNVIEWEENGQKYRYRFRKEPIGVIPSLLKSLLEQRNQTKKELKQTKDNVLKTVLDKRQLAYKVSANSMYGGMGVRQGYLPFLPGAMCTTAKGRESIQRAAEFVKKHQEGKIIYGDSVTEDTLLYIKKTNIRNHKNINILTIKDLYEQYKSESYPQFKLDDNTICNKEKCEASNIEILSRAGWVSVKKIIRHKTLKKIYHISTSKGFVKVTADHSLLLDNNQCIKPENLKPKVHKLMTTSDSNNNISENLHYRKEKWEGIWYVKNNKIFFNEPIDMLYRAYIYYSYKKNYPNLVFEYENNEFIINLTNSNNVPPGLVYKVNFVESCHDYVYDIETEDGSFHCGVGELIVKNTDSIYCHFPKFLDSKNVWNKAKFTEEAFVELFPKPMKLLFEEKIYKDFLILSKKRYMAYTCSEDGILDKDMTIRGVLLARRDNCLFIRKLYEVMVRQIMEGCNFEQLLEIYNSSILSLVQRLGTQDNDINQYVVSKLLNEDYKIKELPTDKTKLQKRLSDLHIRYNDNEITDILKKINTRKSVVDVAELENLSISWLDEYKLKSKPAHFQLSHKLEIRGTPVNSGSRIEFIIIQHFTDPNGKLFNKYEDPDFFMEHRDILRLDYLYYIKNSFTPIDQLFNVVFQLKESDNKIQLNKFGYRHESPAQTIYNYHLNHFKVIKELLEKQKTLIDLI